MLPIFKEWPSIQRLSSETIIITEKIDGTNGIVYVSDDSSIVLAGSRNRWLSNPDGTPCKPGDDNFKFSKWVYDNSETLKLLGPGYHYGEFYGPGIQRGYGVSEKSWVSFEFWRNDLTTIEKVPILFEGRYTPTIYEEVIQQLINSGSVFKPGFMKPEGVVIQFKNVKGAKFKKLCENDLLHKYQQVTNETPT